MGILDTDPLSATKALEPKSKKKKKKKKKKNGLPGRDRGIFFRSTWALAQGQQAVSANRFRKPQESPKASPRRTRAASNRARSFFQSATCLPPPASNRSGQDTSLLAGNEEGLAHEL